MKSSAVVRTLKVLGGSQDQQFSNCVFYTLVVAALTDHGARSSWWRSDYMGTQELDIEVADLKREFAEFNERLKEVDSRLLQLKILLKDDGDQRKSDLCERAVFTFKPQELHNVRKKSPRSIPAIFRVTPQPLPAEYVHTKPESMGVKQGGDEPEIFLKEGLKADVELQIGTLWLNRIGIGSLVLGCVFLILYSFQYFGVFPKLLTGFLVSAALIAGGEYQSRQSNRDWYGSALIGGGWALAYFVAYAMSYIPRLQINHSSFMALLILVGVASGALFHAVKRDSHVLAMVATLFGLVAVSLGPQSNMSYVGYFCISAASAFIAVSKSWIGVIYLSVCGAAVCHLHAAFEIMHLASFCRSISWVDSAFSVGSMFAYWSVSNAAFISFCRDAKAESKLIPLAWLNCLFLVFAINVGTLDPLFAYRYWFFAGAAICYFMGGLHLEQRKLMALRESHTFFALTLLTFALLIKLEGDTRTITLLLESLILVWLHVKERRALYGGFAACLSALTFLSWEVNVNIGLVPNSDGAWWIVKSLPLLLSGAFGALVSIVSARLYHLTLSKESHDDLIPEIPWYAITVIQTNLFAAVAVMLVDSIPVRVMWWALLACLNAGCTLRRSSRVFHWTTLSLLGLTTFAAHVDIGNQISPYVYFLLVLFVAFDAYTFQSFRATKLKWRPFAHAAQLILLSMVFQLSHQFISLGLGCIGICNLTAGFRFDSKSYRGWGLAALGLLTCRLLLVDLAHENSIARILSFTVAGAFLLLGSLAYARFSDKKMRLTESEQLAAAQLANSTN
jgi:hypothetical protein